MKAKGYFQIKELLNVKTLKITKFIIKFPYQLST